MPELTPRERQVLERVCRGLSNKAIAAELGVSEQAVKAHMSRLFLKFGVENRAGLVGAAVTDRERGRHDAGRDEQTADLERQIATLTARNAELESADRGLRADADGPSGASAAD